MERAQNQILVHVMQASTEQYVTEVSILQSSQSSSLNLFATSSFFYSFFESCMSMFSGLYYIYNNTMLML